MIGTMIEHDGDGVLAIHLAKLDDNETISFRTEGLSARTIVDAVSELMLMATGCRTTKPLIHAMASPSICYSDADWALYWDAFETEFGLQGHPYVQVRHLKFGKGGRTAEHAHRVYLRLDVNGQAIRTDFCAVRVQKVSRIAEFLVGERFTPGKFNRSIVDRLHEDGQHDVADAMVRAGFNENQPTCAPSSAERAMTERLNDFAADEVWRRAATAWRRSDTGAAFVAALAEYDFRLGMGRKCPVLISPGGAVHPLLRAINKGGERQRGEIVRKADLDDRLKEIVLPAATDIEPVPNFDAGLFASVNVDRLPVVQTQTPTTVDRPQDTAPTGTVQQRPLTSAQEAALRAMAQAFHSTAADEARAIREAIEAEVSKEVTKKRARALRSRIQSERASWDMPGIGNIGWRDQYKADLAGLPSRYGAHLTWVDRLDAERRRVVLKSGATILLAPDRAWTDNTASRDTMAVMIAYAKEQGWAQITITGSPQWRDAMARAATRAGLVVADTDLEPTINEERMLIEHDSLIADWTNARNVFVTAPLEQRDAAAQAVMAQLERIADQPEVLARISDERQLRRLRADLAALERFTTARGQTVFTGLPTRPG
jgi:hypothetical protein